MNNALLATYGRRPVPMQFVGPVASSAAEYEWLAANVPDASVIGQSLIDHGGRFHDVLRVASPAGVRDYHFDVTAFMGLPTRAAGGVGLPTQGETPAVPATAPTLYRRRSDGAVFRVGWQGRCMDGPVQLVPLDGGAPVEVRYPVLSRDYDGAVATRAAGDVSFGALFPPDKAWMIGKTPREIEATRAQHEHGGIDYTPIVDALSSEHIGLHGIVSVGSGVTEAGPSIIVYVNGSGDEARRNLPAFWGNVPVVVREGGPIVPQWYGAAGAVAPAGDAASDLLTGVLGPLASSGQLDRVVDRLGDQLIDRLLSQPEVQRTIGDAIGKAAVKELSQGVGRPYMTGITMAAGVGALSLLALAALYAAKR